MITETWTDTIVTTNEAICGAWSYSLEMSDGSALTAPFSTDLPALTNFKIFSADEAFIGSHTLTFRAWQSIYSDAIDTVEHSFTVTIVDRCATATVAAANLVDQSYTLREPQGSYAIEAWTASLAYCPFEYTYTVVPAVPDIRGAVVAFDGTMDGDVTAPADRTFTWESLDVAFAGSYQITVTGGLGVTDANSASDSFLLTLVHPCAVATLGVDASVLDASHKRGVTQTSPFTIAAQVTSNVDPAVDCGPIALAFEQDPSGAAIDSIFSFDETAAPALAFVSVTNDPAKVGAYPMGLRATYTNFPGVTTTGAFTVTITEPCTDGNNVLSWTPVALIDRTYDPYNPAAPFTWVDTDELSSTETEAICGDWQFELLMDDTGLALDANAFSSGLPSTFSFTTETSDEAMVGPHTIRVNAWMGSYTAWGTSTVFTVEIVDACLTTAITPSANFGPLQYYWYTTPQITRPFDEFVAASPYCTLTYQLVRQDFTPYETALISENFAAGPPLTMSWFTNDAALVGDYPLRVVGGYKTNTQSFDFTLHVVDPCVTAARSVVSPYWADVSYDILSPEFEFVWSDAAVSVNETMCGDWEYELRFDGNSTALGATGTSVHVELTDRKFQVYSEDHSLIGAFAIVFEAWQSGYRAQAVTDTFTVTYINDCANS